MIHAAEVKQTNIDAKWGGGHHETCYGPLAALMLDALNEFYWNTSVIIKQLSQNAVY